MPWLTVEWNTQFLNCMQSKFLFYKIIVTLIYMTGLWQLIDHWNVMYKEICFFLNTAEIFLMLLENLKSKIKNIV